MRLRNTISVRVKKSGFALLFAVLATGILLSIALAISSIALKELLLSSYGRESQIAFYTSDTALECAMYWEFQHNSFSTSTTPSDISCNNTTNYTVGGGAGTQLLTDIRFGPTNNAPCATLSVEKAYEGSPAHFVTRILSYGHNSCNTGSRERVERGLKLELTSN